jgi:hypothetical protein
MRNVRLAVVMLTVLLAGIAASAASAQPFIVTNTNDSGAGSLRDALAAAELQPGADAIDFSPSVQGTITLASTLLIFDSVEIRGPGAAVLTISGANTVRVLDVQGVIEISGVTFANGLSGSGSGVRINPSSGANQIRLRNCEFTGCTANTGLGGGAIHMTAPAGNNAQLTCEGCTFSQNNSSGGQGGVAVVSQTGGSVQAQFINCTFSGNLSSSGAAVLYINAPTLLQNCTITANQPTGAGSALNVVSGLTMRNTIAAGNILGSGGDVSGGGTSLGGNIVGNNTNCTIIPVSGDQFGTGVAPISPMLATLTDNGGDTRTHAMLANSPALDAGVLTSAPAEDQRGLTRDSQPDCGAYEMQSGSTEVMLGTALPVQGQLYLGGVTKPDVVRSETFTIGNAAPATNKALTLGATPLSFSGLVNCTVSVTTTPAGSVAPGASTPFVVAITPTASGLYSFTLLVASDDQNAPLYPVTVIGFSSAPSSGSSDDSGCTVDEGRGQSWYAAVVFLLMYAVFRRMRRSEPV